MPEPPENPPRRPSTKFVGQVMRGPPLALRPDCSLTGASRALHALGAAEAIVTSTGQSEEPLEKLLGILTHSDLVFALAEDPHPGNKLVTEIMQRVVQTIDWQASLEDAYFELHRLRIHRLPVTREGRIVGLISTDGLLEARSRELEYLRLANASLASAATHDPLTELANRRVFDEALPREVARSQRTGRGLGLLMVDIDHFKNINDTHGHQRGDLVLRELATRLQSQVRRADLVARYGGEEFVVLASVPEPDALLVLAEKLRKAVEATPFALEPSTSIAPRKTTGPRISTGGPLRVTVSIGAAVLTAEKMSPDDLVLAADSALYSAKSAGRNRVVFEELTADAEPRG